MARRGPSLAFCLAAVFAGGVRAETPRIDRIELDSKRSHAEFTVKVMWLIGVSGRFGKVQGTVTADRFRSQAVVDATIDANAVEMGSRRYEEWVKSDEFFDVADHPEIHFVSQSFPLQRLHNGGALEGVLTIRGIDRPETFRFEPAECDQPGYGCPIRVEGSIQRSEFGMHSRRGTLSDTVELRFDVYAVPAPTRLDP